MSQLPDLMQHDGAEVTLAGGGELGARMRAMEWASTPLGPVSAWPQSLKTAVRIMLTSRQPIWLGWGPQLIKLYNDPYKAIVGGKHPNALGQPAAVVWREIWDEIGPMLHTALGGVEGTYVEAQLLIMERNGYPEETYYTFSYSPIPDDRGGVGGIICANTDDTERVIGERQLALLRELAARTADARTFEEACTRSAACLAVNRHDLPFALIYLADAEQRRFVLAGQCGIAADHPAATPEVAYDDPSSWPLSMVLSSQEPQLLGLDGRYGALPTGAWQRPPQQIACVPIAPSGETGKAGVLVVGLNPFRLFDGRYRGFINLVAGQIAASIANAQAYLEERRRAEALAELDRAKTAFFSNVSHEFRTPLTLMLGPAEDALADAGTNAANRERMAVIHRNALRLLKLVNALLEFARLEAGRIDASFEPTDLATLTADLASVFRAAIERAGLELVVDCPPLPEPLYVDRELWEKVIFNLLSNALKFTFAGRITVAMRQAGQQVEVTVQDTGTGIPAAELPLLFERFHRVQNARGRSIEGSGIGLALVQELVQLHGGRVSVASVVDEGTTFTITLPLGKAHLPAERIGAPSSLTRTGVLGAAYVEEALRWLPEAGDAASALRDVGAMASAQPFLAPPSPLIPRFSARILLADDNADMRAYLQQLLSATYEVVAVADGIAALELARTQPFDLILSDVMMPRLDGFGLISALRTDERTRTLPVILLSARAGDEARVEGMTAGADDYLVKPFSARELLVHVAARLEISRVRAEGEAAERRLRLRTERLQALTARLARAVIPADVVQAVLIEGLPALGSTAGSVVRCDGDELEIVGSVGFAADLLRPWRRFPLDSDAPIAIAVRSRRGLWLESPAAFEQCCGRLPSAEVLAMSQAWMALPLVVGDRVLGALGLSYPVAQQFDADARRFAETLADLCAQALERSQLFAALQESERRFRALSDAGILGIIAVDEAGRIVEANGAFLALVGRSEADVARGITWHELTPAEWLAQDLEADQLLKAQGFVSPYEKEFQRPDGARVPVLIGATLSDRRLGIAFVLDITARKQAEEALRTAITREQELRQQAEEASRLKDEFLATVSHELRTPLTALLGYAHLLQSRKRDEAYVARTVERIVRSAKDQAQLIEDLLDVSRIASGKLRMVFELLDLRSVVRAAVDTVIPTLEAKQQRLELVLGDSPLLVQGDAGRLQQVVWNLLANAVKFTPAEGSVAIQLGRESSEAMLTVSDTGQGMSAAFLPHAFDRFRQADGTTQRAHGGLGLGLAIVRHIVELHGGYVTAASDGLNAGASFTVRLPLAPEELAGYGRGAMEAALLLSAYPPELRGLRLLLVDDQPIILKLLEEMLTAAGAIVQCCSNAFEALAVLQQWRPDILVSDLAMPEEDGFWLIGKVRALPPEAGGTVPAVALTAHARVDGHLRVLEAGFQQYLAKPVAPDELYAVLAQLVRF